MRSYLSKQGFTMTEIVISMMILTILMTKMTPVFNSQVTSSRIDTVEGNLIIYKSDTEAYWTDYGVFNLNPESSIEYKAKAITGYLNSLSTNYLHVSFDMETLMISPTSFSITTLTADPWGTPYTMFYNTDYNSSTCGTVVYASNGPDSKLTSSTYSNGEFADDILVTIVPKIPVIPNSQV